MVEPYRFEPEDFKKLALPDLNYPASVARFHKAYFERVETLAWAAAERGMDFAISEPEWRGLVFHFEHIELAPDIPVALPPGKRWTIYHASKFKTACDLLKAQGYPTRSV